MKIIFATLFLIFGASTAEAGRVHTGSYYVLRVDCVVLESFPLQYSGTARLYSNSTGRTVQMRFITSTDTDVQNVCQRLRALTRRNVQAFYNFRETVPTNPITRIIHGFSRRGVTHLVNGSVFEDRSE